ncbi:MAG TPA: sugar-binding protein, partial [Lachnospiraceae bacterium]|nr:sugar-binding protein [Lachnospiraceae bacterium]
MRKKMVALTMAVLLSLSTVACGSGGTTDGNKDTSTQSADSGNKGSGTTVANKDKPLVWFNRQPSNSSTGELDMTAL